MLDSSLGDMIGSVIAPESNADKDAIADGDHRRFSRTFQCLSHFCRTPREIFKSPQKPGNGQGNGNGMATEVRRSEVVDELSGIAVA